jgi:hypothetical protein
VLVHGVMQPPHLCSIPLWHTIGWCKTGHPSTFDNNHHVVAWHTLSVRLATCTSSKVGAHHRSLHKISAPLNFIKI